MLAAKDATTVSSNIEDLVFSKAIFAEFSQESLELLRWTAVQIREV